MNRHRLANEIGVPLAGRPGQMTAPLQAAESAIAPSPLPLVIHYAATPAAEPERQVAAERDHVHQHLAAHGAVLLRGLVLRDAAVVERVARTIAGALRSDFPGTPPNRLTDFVFPASDLAGWFPIAQHCEMSFLREPPRLVFFACLEPPAAGSGETPLSDGARVWRDLPTPVRARFEARGVAITRNYRGPATRRPGPWTLERWDQAFGTGDPQQVVEICRREGFACEWTGDGRLRVVQTQPARRNHPTTDTPVWFNQAIAHHLESPRHEYRRILRLRPSLRAAAGWLLVTAQITAKRLGPRDRLAYSCSHADGGEIDPRDLEVIREVTWRNLAITSWERGDLLVLDNRRIAHGRFPFRGRRSVVACLA